MGNPKKKKECVKVPRQANTKELYSYTEQQGPAGFGGSADADGAEAQMAPMGRDRSRWDGIVPMGPGRVGKQIEKTSSQSWLAW